MNIQFISHLISNIGCSAMIAFFFIKIDRAKILLPYPFSFHFYLLVELI